MRQYLPQKLRRFASFSAPQTLFVCVYLYPAQNDCLHLFMTSASFSRSRQSAQHVCACFCAHLRLLTSVSVYLFPRNLSNRVRFCFVDKARFRLYLSCQRYQLSSMPVPPLCPLMSNAATPSVSVCICPLNLPDALISALTLLSVPAYLCPATSSRLGLSLHRHICPFVFISSPLTLPACIYLCSATSARLHR